MAIICKVWIEIEKYDTITGKGEDVETLNILPFASSATTRSLKQAVRVAKIAHSALNNS